MEREDPMSPSGTSLPNMFQQFRCGDLTQKIGADHFLTLSAFLDTDHIDEYLFRQHWKRSLHTQDFSWLEIFSSTTATTTEIDAIQNATIIDRSNNEYSPTCDQPSWNSNLFWELVHEAIELSLCEAILNQDSGETVAYSMDILVREWLQLRVDEDQQRAFSDEANVLVVTSIPCRDPELATTRQDRRLLKHMDACLSNDEKFYPDGTRLGQDLQSLDVAGDFAEFYHRCGRYITAEALEREMLRTKQREYSPDSQSILQSMSDIADLLHAQQRYDEATEMCQRAADFSEKILGQSHAGHLQLMNGLALMLNDASEYGNAEVVSRYVLQIAGIPPSGDLPDFVTSLNELSTLISTDCVFEEVQRAGQVMRLGDALGLTRDNIGVLARLNRLSMSLRRQGKHEEVEEVSQRMLHMCEENLGRCEPLSLVAMMNLGYSLKNQQEYREAEEIFRHALRMSEQLLGTDHLDTLATRNVLAQVLVKLKRPAEGEMLHRYVLEQRRRILGPEHPNTVRTMSDLAYALTQTGSLEEAELLQIYGIEIGQRIWDSESQEALSQKSVLASIRIKQNRISDAIGLLEDLVEGRAQLLGPDHSLFVSSVQRLAQLRSSLKDEHKESTVGVVIDRPSQPGQLDGEDVTFNCRARL